MCNKNKTLINDNHSMLTYQTTDDPRLPPTQKQKQIRGVTPKTLAVKPCLHDLPQANMLIRTATHLCEYFHNLTN